MKKVSYYRYDQSLPPKHWYQKRVGWFGKSLMAVMVLTFFGASSYGYIMNRATVKSFAAETSNPDRLHKVTSVMSTETPENIVDVQYILDSWAKKHPGETWSVSAKSIDGPNFDAAINQDKEYESASMQQLLLALPLFAQVAPEYHKSVMVSVGGSSKSMQSCVDLMIRLSNSDCAKAVSEYIDFKKANDSLKSAGLTSTTLSDSKTVRTTAADMTEYLYTVNSKAFATNSRETVLRLLREQQTRSGIPKGCPGCVIANKSQLGDVTNHDVAIVRYSGGSYVLSIFTNKGEASQISELAGAIQQKILDTTRN